MAGRRVQTTTRSASVTASIRSWVTSTTVCPVSAASLQQQVMHGELELCVERGERLVEQRGLGAVEQHARQARTLAHAA